MDETGNNKGLLRVAIVGGGRRCNEMLEMVALGELKVEVIGVADIDPNAEGVKSARKKGIYTTSDFKDLYKIEGLDLIIELTGDPEVYHKINQTKPQDVQAIGYMAARLFWDIVSDERKAKERIRDSEQRHRVLFERGPDAIVVANTETKRFEFVNETACRMLGYTRDEFLKLVVSDIHSKEDLPYVLERFNALTREEIEVAEDIPVLRSDGTIFYADIHAPKMNFGGRTYLVGFFRDVTERKSMEEALRASEQRYKNLYKKTKVLAERDSLTDLFNRRRIGELLENEIERAKRKEEVFSVMMLDVDDLKLINDAYGHVVGDKLLVNVAKALKNSCRSVDLIGRYGGDEFMIILPYTHGEKAGVIAQRICEKIRQQGLKINGIRNIPIRLSIGVATYPFDSMLPKELITLADRRMYESKQSGETIVSVSIPGVKEYLATKEPTLSVLEGLVTAVDGKDHYTKAHSELVTRFSLSLGKELNLSHEEMEALRIAGLLHDIGKIGIPENILKKPGPLETKEFELIKQHPRLGAMMIDGPPPHREYVLDAINYHHERYDGKGYPDRLKGEEIPLLARVIGIADAYCAMISDRPYRKALTQDEAIAELEKGAGTQFDPELVAKFIKCIKEK